MLTCPGCNRKIFTVGDILRLEVDGELKCRSCGRAAQLDLKSRLLISCLLALVFSALTLYTSIFYTGHFVLISTLLILVGWTLLALAVFPLLELNIARGARFLNRWRTLLIWAVFLVGAAAVDNYMDIQPPSNHTVDTDARKTGARGSP